MQMTHGTAVITGIGASKMDEVLEFNSVGQKARLPQRVLENLKSALISGALKPGDKLPSISEMAAQMDVGISSVREAVKMLEVLGILESRQGSGTFVSPNISDSAFNVFSLQMLLMPRSVKDLVEFRRIYETVFTHLAASNIQPEDIEDIEKIVSNQELMAKSKTKAFGEKEEWDFHSRVLEATHNPYIISMGKAMLELFLSTLPQSAEVVSNFSIVTDHRNLFEYMKAKNYGGMDKILNKSFDGWEQRLLGIPFVEPGIEE
jgi:GntR family transcriptional repressor for pyruvate dehydrogenase complex